MLPRPTIDEVRLERACIAALQAADRGRFTAGSADGQVLRVLEASFASMGWMYMDLDRAVVELETIVELQRLDGCLPPTAGAAGAAAPLLATILRMIYHAARSRHRKLEGRIAALVPAIDLYHQHLQGKDRRWLCQISVEDERIGPAAPHDGTGAVPDVGFNALLVQAETDLADVSIHTGYPTRQIIARRTHRARAIADRLWCEQQAIFVSRTASGEAPGSVPSAAGLLPLWCGAALGHQARAMAARHLGAGSPLISAFPLATLVPGQDPAESAGPADSPRPWHGAMMPLLNWLLVRGAYRYGLEELASSLENAVLVAADRSGLREAYDPHTGAGLGSANPTLSAVIALDLLKTPYDFERWGVY